MILIATQKLLDEYPELANAGLKVGDDFEVFAEALNLTNEEENPNNSESDEGGDPPPGGNSPDKKPIIP